jgi:hypothetical protein
MSFNLTHARVDPAHCLAPGLFRSLKRGERVTSKLDITYLFGDGCSVRFWGPEPLGADDLRVLQGLISMAAVSGEDGRGISLTQTTSSEVGCSLRSRLDLQGLASQKDAIVVMGSFTQLGHEIGLSDKHGKVGGSQINSMKNCVERLWATSVILDCHGERQGFRVLSQYASNEFSLCVALNPKLFDAITGHSQHIRINLNEVRLLGSDVARLIHARLCGWINAGKSGKVGIDTLCAYVWQNGDTVDAAALKRQHHVKIRQALSELIGIGWLVDEYAKGKFEIKRAKS